MPITFKHAEVLGHSLGINVYHAKHSTKKKDKKLPAKFYRNRFCAGSDHDDMPTLLELEKLGYMSRGSSFNSGSQIVWFVTDVGKEIFIECFESVISA
jgi:hypothetical protein